MSSGQPGQGPEFGKATRAQGLGRAPGLPGTGTEPRAGTVRVLCVDDHAVLVEGLKAQFEIDGTVQCVGWLASADRLLEECRRLKPDVVLLDIEMPGLDAFEAADRLRRVQPDARVVILSAHIRGAYLEAARRAGAWGYFAKADEPAQIVAGVLAVARGGRGTFVMGEKVRARCLATAGTNARRAGSRRGSESGPATGLATLTEREREVLRLIGKGLSRTQIAAELSRSPKTIDGHQERIMRKVGVASRAELIRLAIREGLVEP